METVFILSASFHFVCVIRKQRLFVNIIIYTTKICKSFSHKILFLCILPIFIYFNLRIRASKVLSGSAAWQMAQENIVQVTFVRWRGDSKIVEANAEHDFCFKRLIGMFRTMERAQYSLVPSAKRRCRTELLTPESYQVKSSSTALSLFHLLRNHAAQHPASGAQGKNSGKIRRHICNAPVYRQ